MNDYRTVYQVLVAGFSAKRTCFHPRDIHVGFGGVCGGQRDSETGFLVWGFKFTVSSSSTDGLCSCALVLTASLKKLHAHTHTENSKCSGCPNKSISLWLPRAMSSCRTRHFWNFSERRIRAAQKTVSCFLRILERDWFCISLSYTGVFFFVHPV